MTDAQIAAWWSRLRGLNLKAAAMMELAQATDEQVAPYVAAAVEAGHTADRFRARQAERHPGA